MHDPGGLVDRTGWNIARKDTDSLGEMLSGIFKRIRGRGKNYAWVITERASVLENFL